MTNRKLAYIVKEQNPLTLSGDKTVQYACQQMTNRRVGAVLVTDNHGRLLGIFTGRDALQLLAQGKSTPATTLAEAMTPCPLTIAPEKTALDALRIMCDGGFRHLPIVADDKIVGIVSRSDFKGLELDRLEEETHLWERIG